MTRTTAAGLLVALGSPAYAEPWLDAQIGADLPVSASEPALALGVGFSAGGPFRAEALARAEVLASGGAHLTGLGAGRFYAVHPDRRQAWRPSLLVGAGWQGGYTQGPAALAGLDIDLPTGFPVYGRLGLAVRAGPAGRWSAGLHVGVVGRPWAPRPTPVVQVLPAEPPPADPLALADPTAGTEPAAATSAEPAAEADTVLWWDPQSCTWVDTAPTVGWRPEDGLAGPGPAPASDGGPGGTEAPGGPAAASQGWLMVVARPGDVIQLGELNQQVGPDGVARLRAPEGDVRVEVVGGGRTQAFEAAIAAGYALWLRAAPPEEVRVTFPVNRATLADADRVRVTALARNRGSWLLRVSGSYSPEGRVEDNLALATARAAALADLLRAAGVPENAILVAPPTPPRPGLSPAEQRAVYVQPVDPETSP